MFNVVPLNLAAQFQKRRSRDLRLYGHYAGLGMHPTCFRESFAILTEHRQSDTLCHRKISPLIKVAGFCEGSQVHHGTIQHFAEMKTAERVL